MARRFLAPLSFPLGDGIIVEIRGCPDLYKEQQDGNHNGLSEPSELYTLNSQNVAALEFDCGRGQFENLEQLRRRRWLVWSPGLLQPWVKDHLTLLNPEKG